MLLAVLACGEDLDPPGLLGDEPRVLAFRLEVVEPGPLSEGLLPIPADRVRDEALPGDVVELSAWVVSAQREYETDDLEPVWFSCPRSGSCLSSLARPSAEDPCKEQVSETAACRLGQGESPRFTMPQLTEDLPLLDQYAVPIVMIGHTSPDRTTQACIDIVSDPAGRPWDGCIVGSHLLPMGPAARLYVHAIETGVEVPVPGLQVPGDGRVVPHFNPEAASMRLVPVFSDGSQDLTRVVEAWPDEVTTLEPGFVYSALDVFDSRDVQTFTRLDFDGLSSNLGPFPPWVRLSTGTPGVLRIVTDDRARDDFAFTRYIVAPEDPAAFSIHLALLSPAGGAAWATYLFEVPEP